MRFHLLLIFLWFFHGDGCSQAGYVRIDSIFIQGNNKTRSEIVLRELPFRKGDTLEIDGLATHLQKGEQWLMNTGLFNRASIYFRNWEGDSDRVQLQVDVEEAWYFYPIPLFELADRNFNVWWVDHQRSLERVNYGLDFLYRNATGRGDRLNATIKQGYSKMLLFQYQLPYLNQKKDLGISLYTLYSRNREINYATLGNKQAFFRLEDDFSLTRFITQATLTYRPGLTRYYRLSLGFFRNQVAPEVLERLGVDFFLNGQHVQRYLTLGASYTFDNRDARPYPMAGAYFWTELRKDGLGIFPDRNALTLWTDYQRFFQLGSSPFNLGMAARGKLSLIRQLQPYNDYRALGYQRNTLRGYEYYVVEGLDMLLIKSSLRAKLWEDQITFGKIVPISAFRRIPFKLMLALNSDLGYINDPWNPYQNSFSNRLLWGRGIGLDAVILFNFVLRMEASMNHLGEKGLFFHFNMNL